jgi:hypothetical protein
VIRILISPEVLREIETVVGNKAPALLADMAVLMDRAGIEVISKADSASRRKCRVLLDYEPDADVLASAWREHVDYFVTLDRKHFLDNDALKEKAPFPLGTPGDAVAWIRERIAGAPE